MGPAALLAQESAAPERSDSFPWWIVGVGIVLVVVAVFAVMRWRTARGLGARGTVVPPGDGFSAERSDVVAYVSVPRSDGSATESNPYNVGVYSTAGGEGATVFSTAQVFTTPERQRQVVLQYWQLDTEGDAISGTLTDSHRREGAALNLLTSAVPIVPCQPNFGTMPQEFAVAEGATMAGTITSDTLRLEVVGTSTDQQRAFRSLVEASR